MMTSRRSFILTFLIGIGLLVLPSLAPRSARGEGDRVSVGEVVPNFSLSSLGGGEVSLADFRGKVLLVNFFASW